MTIAAVAVCWFAIGAAVALGISHICRRAEGGQYLPAGVERVKHPATLPPIPEWANPYAAPTCPDAIAVYDGVLCEVWL